MAYTSKTAAFAADIADLLAVYKADGLAAADLRACKIAAERNLTAAEALTLADGFRRRAVYA